MQYSVSQNKKVCIRYVNDACIVQKCEGIQHAKLTQNVLKLTEMFKMDDFYNWRNF